MSTRSCHQSRQSHLSSDFVWDNLPSTTTFHHSDPATRTSIDDQTDWKVSFGQHQGTDNAKQPKSRSRSSKKSVPSPSLVLDKASPIDQLDPPTPLVINTPAAVGQTNPLQVRVHKLEVQKLQLQLELVRLQSAPKQDQSDQQAPQQATGSHRDDSTKSLSDMKHRNIRFFPKSGPTFLPQLSQNFILNCCYQNFVPVISLLWKIEQQSITKQL